MRLWRRKKDGVSDSVVATAEGDRFAAQQRNDDLESFLQAADAVVGRVAERLILGVVPPCAQTENEPAAAADRVSRDRHLREQSGIPIRGARDQLADLDACRRRGERGGQRPRFVNPFERRAGHAAEEVIADPNGVEADGLCMFGERADVRPQRHSAGSIGERHGNHDADPHARSLTARR